MDEISRAVIERHEQAGYRCEHCNNRSMEIAHGISQGKNGKKFVYNTVYQYNGTALTKLQIDKIIHHKLNTWAVCGKDCNSYFSINLSSVQAVEQAINIYKVVFDEV